MIRNQTLTIIILFAIIFSSCTHIYVPALYHQDIAYLPKPASFDSARVATYVSAGGSIYTNTDYADMLQSGQVNLSQGFRLKNVNLAYGVFGVAGDYDGGQSTYNNVSSNVGNKFFGAVGGRASANLYTSSGQFDIRYIGVEAAYSHEFGDYLDYRRSVYGLKGFNVDPRTDLFTLGLTSELYFHSQNNSDLQHGIRGFMGGTFGHYDEDYQASLIAPNGRFFHSLFPKASYFIKYKKYFGSVEFGNGLFARFGLQF